MISALGYRLFTIALFTKFLLVARVTAVEPELLDSFESPSLRAGNEHVQIDSVKGHQGKALHLTFAKDAKSTFAMGKVRGSAKWDQAAGISFWVKGDGSTSSGAIQFVWNEDYAVRYDAAFSISSTEWSKVTIPWSDLIPVTAKAKAIPIDPAGPRKPSKLGQIWFGKWWYWGTYPAYSYTIDDIYLEPAISQDKTTQRPKTEPLARVKEKLAAGKTITVVTMGDSLTDVRHWTNRKTNWPLYFSDAVKKRWQVSPVLVNPAIGGTELQQNTVLVPRWLATTPKPDLVTICFGFNDYASGVRGEDFQTAMANAIRRVRRLTGGSADVLIITTVPSIPKAKELAEMADAGRKSAAAENAGLCDAYRAFQLASKNGGSERLFADDKVHLSPAGQQVLAEAVIKAIDATEQ